MPLLVGPSLSCFHLETCGKNKPDLQNYGLGILSSMVKERPGSYWSLEKKGNLGIMYKERCWKEGEKEMLHFSMVSQAGHATTV